MADDKVTTPTRAPSSAGDKVIVACKIPNGLQLRVFKMVNDRELVMGGGTRDIKRAEPQGEPITVHGPAVPHGVRPDFPIVDGYALTEGVDKEFWEAWLKANKDSMMVRNGLIMAYADLDSARDGSKEHAEIRTGLEPLDRDSDPRARGGLKVTEEEGSKERRKAA